MSLKKTILATAVLLGLTAFLNAAEPGHEAAPTAATAAPAVESAGAEAAAHGLPAAAVPVFHIGAFPVTNSMLVTWIVAIGIIIFAQVAMRKMQAVPSGLQNFWEWLVESGVGTIVWGVETPRGFQLTAPFFRGGNADLNMTAAMAVIFMMLWLFWSLREAGVKGFFLHIFGPKGDSTGFIKYMMIVVFFAVGFLEVVSIAFRPVSLSFRLYGNIFAGENLLESLANTVQHPAWAKAVFSALLPVPFYFLELLVGLVQAFVFMLLTTVFTSLMCTHEEEPGKEKHH